MVHKYKIIQDSRMYKMQKREFKNWRAQLFERDLRLIKLRSVEFWIKPNNPRKRLGFEFNISKFKSKTLKHVFQVLESFSFEIWEVLCLLPFQASIGVHSHTRSTNGIKLQPKLQISSVLKIKDMNWRFMLKHIHIEQVWGF